MSYKYHLFSDDEAERLYRDMVPILAASEEAILFAPQSEPVQVPLLVLDSRIHADLLDVADIIATEGAEHRVDPQVLYGAVENPGLLIRYPVPDPATGVINVFLRWPTYADLLERVVTHGCLYLTAGESKDVYIRIAIPAEDLAEMLAMWKQRGEDHKP